MKSSILPSRILMVRKKARFHISASRDWLDQDWTRHWTEDWTRGLTGESTPTH